MALKKINYTGQSKVILRLCEMVNQLIDGGGGGGSTVTYTPSLSSGTKTGEIEIDGVSTDMYAPTPPTKLSDLTNDAGFIDNTVNNLVNYYKKTETYTQAEVNALISAIVTLNILVVQTLPTQDISTTTIYLVPKATAETQDVYDEYIYVNNAWEHIGSTQVDLSNYYTQSETDALLADKVDKVAGKQLSTKDFTSALKSKLEGIEAGAQANVQADWNQTDNTADDYIKNKPTIPSGGDSVTWTQIQQGGTKIAEIDINGIPQDVYAPQGGGGSYTEGDGINITNDEISVDTAFTEASTRANIASGDTLATIWGKIKKFFSDLKTVAFSGSYSDLSNTPNLATVATSGSYTDLSNKPTIPDVSTKVSKSGDSMTGALSISASGTDTPLYLQGNSANGTFIAMKNNAGTTMGYLYGRNNNRGGFYYGGAYHDFAYLTDVPTYNFSGTNFYSGNSNTAEHNANNAVKNGHYYYTSNGPSTSLGASTTDGSLYVQSYNDSWVSQIAQDYRNGRLFVRGKNNGTWQGWLRIAMYSEIPTTITWTQTVITYTSGTGTWNVSNPLGNYKYYIVALSSGAQANYIATTVCKITQNSTVRVNGFVDNPNNWISGFIKVSSGSIWQLGISASSTSLSPYLTVYGVNETLQ